MVLYQSGIFIDPQYIGNLDPCFCLPRLFGRDPLRTLRTGLPEFEGSGQWQKHLQNRTGPVRPELVFRFSSLRLL